MTSDMTPGVGGGLQVAHRRIVEAGPAEDMLNSENPFIRQFLSGESQGPLTTD